MHRQTFETVNKPEFYWKCIQQKSKEYELILSAFEGYEALSFH